MMKNGVVELPIIIPKETFLHELNYFGFDVTAIDIDCISCAVPTYEAATVVAKVNTDFSLRFKDFSTRISGIEIEKKYAISVIEIEKEYSILAYVCFCEYVCTASLTCSIRSIQSEALTRPSIKPMVSEIALFHTAYSLYYLCYNRDITEVIAAATMALSDEDFRSAAISNNKKLLLFCQELARYGLQLQQISGSSNVVNRQTNVKKGLRVQYALTKQQLSCVELCFGSIFA
jgi:hypothetical protein